MQVSILNRTQLEREPLPPNSAVLTLFDRNNTEPEVFDKSNCVDHLRVECNDVTEHMLGLDPPSNETAATILRFMLSHSETENFIVTCEQGTGRAAAVTAALFRLYGNDKAADELLFRGVHNRLLYKLLMEEGRLPMPQEPLVSVIVRAQFPVNYIRSFMLSLERQRYENWQAVVVTDGPRPDIREELAHYDGRVKLIETVERKWAWGNAHRQVGLDACEGEYVCMGNDDNQICPGYLEQLVNVLNDGNDLALCDCIHSYFGYAYQESEPRRCGVDLSAWMARAELAKSVEWPGAYSEADGEYVERMARACGPHKIGKIDKALVFHN
jgi:hypothetical protein